MLCGSLKTGGTGITDPTPLNAGYKAATLLTLLNTDSATGIATRNLYHTFNGTLDYDRALPQHDTLYPPTVAEGWRSLNNTITKEPDDPNTNNIHIAAAIPIG
jgi:hypothetical protein